MDVNCGGVPLRNYFKGRLVYALFVGLLCAGSSGLAFGYSSGSAFQIFLTVEWSAVFASCLNIGGLFGSLFSGYLMTRFGRRWTMLVSFVPGIAGWIGLRISADAVYDRYAPNALFMVSRVMTGVSAGMSIPAAAAYVIEIAPEHVHNFCGTLPQIGIVTGITLSYVFGASFAWEVTAIYNATILTTLLLMTSIIPESPKWLAKTKQFEKAETANTILYSTNAPGGGEKSLDTSADTSSPVETRLRHYLLPHTAIPSSQRRQLNVACLMMLLQQLSGINAIMYFAESICMFGNLSNASVCAIIIGASQMVFTIIASYFIHRVSRKRMLHYSSLIMMAAHFIHGLILLSLPEYPLWSIITKVCIVVYLLGFSIGWGPLPILVINDLFPTATRGFGISAAVSINWIASFAVTVLFEPLTYLLGPVVLFWTFSFCCLISLLFVRRYIVDATSPVSVPSSLP